ncbi:MAG: aminotransferase class I/II-fold pyridoxal phosphate-dependent enzyme [Planctomyces sp.]|nr:aminotransferase class I/II-fold pyridoxal phosphate-dependent enzyme [Planctomyces sp.]
MIDLRSDTVTKPSAAMRQAMLTAEVGDDTMGEDPTVRELEERIAAMFGKEAALYACSGTQGNQLGVRAHCIPGDELLIHETGHIAVFEGGAPAALSGVTVRTLPGPLGKLDVDVLSSQLRPFDQHFPRTKLICLENTTNLGGGRCYSLEHMQRVAGWARENDLKLHLDGARIFNAIIAHGYSAADVGSCFDTISICFSKGLGCPMGSALVGSKDEILRARRARKMFGGTLRQTGIVAVTALYALDHHVQRLAIDHEHARLLAHGLASIDGIRIDSESVETNLIYFEIEHGRGTAVQLASALRDHDVQIGPMGGQRMRAVTHLDISRQDIDTVVEVVKNCFKAGFADRPLTGSGPYSR